MLPPTICSGSFVRRSLPSCQIQCVSIAVIRPGAAAAQASGVDVRHVHALYHEIIARAGLLPRLESEDAEDPAFFPQCFPELAAEALCEASVQNWDVLVVDEAQDLLTPEHLDAFDFLVKDGLGEDDGTSS